MLQSITAAFCVTLALCATAIAQDAAPKSSVLFTNANVFDGQHEALAPGMSVLVEGNKITKIAKSIPAPAGATVIDARGKVLMPGLTDVHWHVMFNAVPIRTLMTADMSYLTLLGARSAQEEQRVGHTLIADGLPEVTKRTREALRMGASQVKAMAGGGVSSLYDPLDVPSARQSMFNVLMAWMRRSG